MTAASTTASQRVGTSAIVAAPAQVMSSVPGGSSVRRAGADEPLDLARPVPQQGSGAARTDDQVDGVFPCALRDQCEGVEVHPVHQVGPSAPPLPSMVQGGEVDDLEARDPFLARVEVEPQYGAAPGGTTVIKVRGKHRDLQMSSNSHAASS